MQTNIIQLACLICLLFINNSDGYRCDRKPYTAQSQAAPSDGRFKLSVEGAEDNAYIPGQLYTVTLSATDGESQFTGFMISAEGDTKLDPHNPRRVIPLYPGEIRPINPTIAKFSKRCPFSVENAMSSTKTSVEIYWDAPQSGNGCVNLRAMVQENDELWFEDGAPLSLKLCEDMRQPDDVAPQINYECNICDEAKYEVAFTGIWSRNTHPLLFPENDWVLKYSNLVGASHSPDLILWSPGSLASDGLKELAENVNTSKFEQEIMEKIGDGVQTMIKGKGHGYRRMGEPMYSFFRANKDNHLLSVAVGIHPSPDWFLGVARFELCQDDTWLAERELNLYPWDAGTDSGVSYESPNLPTVPQDSVTRVEMSTHNKNSPFYEVDMKQIHPFGKLHITLIRTYHRDCEEATEEPTEEGNETPVEKPDPEEGSDANGEDPIEPSRYQNPEIDSSVSVGLLSIACLISSTSTTEAAIVSDPKSYEECPMSPWTDWSSCEGICEDDKIKGYKWRERYHLINGVAVEKYDPYSKRTHKKEVSKYCKENFDDFERTDCEEDCPEIQNQEETAERQIMRPSKPGFMFYYTKKRDVQ